MDETLETMGKKETRSQRLHRIRLGAHQEWSIRAREDEVSLVFAPKMQVFESGEVQDMCGEDVSFCLDAIEAGFDIWCDPLIRSRARENKSHLGGHYARSKFNRPI